MRKILFIFTICLVYSFSNICLAYPNEKNGFRNFYWGESLQEVQANDDIYDLEYIGYNQGENSVEYIAKLKNPYISNQESNSIIFYFWNNKLYEIYIDFYTNTANPEFLRQAMIRNFGEPKQEGVLLFVWYGQQIEISLSWGMHTMGLYLNNPYLKAEAIKDGSLKGW